MKALVIYDSVFGKTQNIAQAIAQTVGETFTTRLVPAREATVSVLKEGKLLFIGSPTHQYTPTPVVQAFLEQIPDDALRGVMGAAFDTRYRVSSWSSGSAAWEIARRLQRAGASLIVPPESFFVAAGGGSLERGEVERARQWTRAFLEKVQPVSMTEASIFW